MNKCNQCEFYEQTMEQLYSGLNMAVLLDGMRREVEEWIVGHLHILAPAESDEKCIHKDIYRENAND